MHEMKETEEHGKRHLDISRTIGEAERENIQLSFHFY